MGDNTKINDIVEKGQLILKASILYYDLVNDTDNYDICLNMQSEVLKKSDGKKYRYKVKIEKEEI